MSNCKNATVIYTESHPLSFNLFYQFKIKMFHYYLLFFMLTTFKSNNPLYDYENNIKPLSQTVIRQLSCMVLYVYVGSMCIFFQAASSATDI